MIVKNIFITGKPGCGKTSLIKEILKELKIPKYGFLSEEIRENKERVGFKILTLHNKEGILAKKGLESPFLVSKYGVNIKVLEEIGVKEIEEGLKKDCLLVIDEIGKMELLSLKFKKIVLKALNSKNKVLGTIMLKSHPFCDKIKQRKDTKVFLLAKGNKEKVKKEIEKFL